MANTNYQAILTYRTNHRDRYMIVTTLDQVLAFAKRPAVTSIILQEIEATVVMSEWRWSKRYDGLT